MLFPTSSRKGGTHPVSMSLSLREFFLCRVLCPCYTRLHPGSHGPCPTEERALELLFPDPELPYSALVDVGCGSGGVLAWWLQHGFAHNTLTGIEVNRGLAAWARRRFRSHPQVRILSGDAVRMVSTLPSTRTLFYLFNPFDAPTLEAFLREVGRHYAPDTVEIVYYNSEHAAVFLEDPAWTVTPVALPAPCWPALRAHLCPHLPL